MTVTSIVVDLLVVALLARYACAGYHAGLATSLLTVAGVVAGLAAVVGVGNRVLPGAPDRYWVAALTAAALLAFLFSGYTAGRWAGAWLQRRLTCRSRSVNTWTGLVFAVVTGLVAVGQLASALEGVQVDGVGSAVGSSVVLAVARAATPAPAARWLRRIRHGLATGPFADHLAPFAPSRADSVLPPAPRIVTSPGVKAARRSVLKVLGVDACGTGVEGSGFVYAPGRVMTNAHVVAGVAAPVVQVGNAQLPARVVYYDPHVDVAVLAVAGLHRPSLRFSAAGHRGEPAAALGYPEDGPYRTVPVRLRDRQRLSAPDIYGRGDSRRGVFALRGRVRHGNSGGPLVDAAGQVLGMVFAASTDHPDTGYAITAAQLAAAAAEGRAGWRSVSTGGCS